MTRFRARLATTLVLIAGLALPLTAGAQEPPKKEEPKAAPAAETCAPAAPRTRGKTCAGRTTRAGSTRSGAAARRATAAASTAARGHAATSGTTTGSGAATSAPQRAAAPQRAPQRAAAPAAVRPNGLRQPAGQRTRQNSDAGGPHRHAVRGNRGSRRGEDANARAVARPAAPGAYAPRAGKPPITGNAGCATRRQAPGDQSAAPAARPAKAAAECAASAAERCGAHQRASA